MFTIECVYAMNQMYRFVLFLVVFYALIGKHFNCLAHQQPVSVPTTPYNNEFAFEFIFFLFQLFAVVLLPYIATSFNGFFLRSIKLAFQFFVFVF